MSLLLPNGSKYKLCLLDTNALSEIVKYPAIVGHGFVKKFPPNEFIPCFTVYNLIELRRRTDVYKKFIEFFGIYPSLITKPFQLILDKEIEVKGRARVNDIILNAFTPSGKDSSFHLGNFIDQLFSGSEMAKLEIDWRNRDQIVLDTWLKNKANFNPINSIANARDAKRFVKDASIDTLCQLKPNFVQDCIDANIATLLQTFPSVQVMLYSQYYRIFDPTWKPKDQEMTDVYISACSPYVDAVVTESFQAEIYKKNQKYINGMSIIITKIRDIRNQG